MTQPKGRASIPRRALDAKQYNRRITLQCGRQVSYAEVGDPRGLPVICLLGMRGHRYHSYLYSNLAYNHSIRLICVDRPGYGLSDNVTPSNLPHPIAFVYVMEQFLTILQIDRFALIAQSAGCIYALAMAAQESFVTRILQPVVLIAPWVGIQNSATRPLLKFAAMFPTAMISAGIKMVDVSNDLTSISANPNYILAALGNRVKHNEYIPLNDETVPFHEFQQRIQNEPNNVFQDAILCLGKCKNGFGFEFPSIEAKITVYHGNRDSLVPLKAAQEFVESLPNADLHIVENGTHMILFDEDIMDRVFQSIEDAKV